MDNNYSINTGLKKIFTVTDYVLFGLTLAISAGIGFFYAFKDRNKNNSKEYLLGGRGMSVLPVAMSLLVTLLSALTLLGTPAEMYNFNTMFWWICLGYVFALLATAIVFIPFFYKLRITSIFQYLEMRFNKPVRTLAVILNLAPALIYMAFVLYGPSLALNSVTGINLWGSVIGVGAVVTLYTALGGMKAVVWTDTFQTVIIVVGLLAVLIQGSIVVGGFQNAWSVASNRSRILFDDFDPSTRHSFWSVVIGYGFISMSQYGCNQAQVQRMLACPTLRKAQQAILINIPGLIFIVSLCCMIGIVMHAFYADCHPLKFNSLIFSTDQLLPLFVMDILGDMPGLPGVFVSCIFSGSLSTLSSGLNAFSAIIPYDLILPYCCKTMSERSLTILSKVIVVVFGALTIAFAYVVSEMGNILQAAIAITSALSGPVFGIFVLGMFFPWANSAGAMVGSLFSSALMLWICIGAFVNRASTARFSPVFTHGCNWNVTTTTLATITVMSATNATEAVTSLPTARDPFYPMYTVSYLYYTPIAMTATIIVGLIVSVITGRRDPKRLDPRLICPLFDDLFPCLPEMILKPFRCGINHNGKYNVPDKPTDFVVEVTTNDLPEKKNIGDDKANPNIENGAAVLKDDDIQRVFDNQGYSGPEPITTRM